MDSIVAIWWCLREHGVKAHDARTRHKARCRSERGAQCGRGGARPATTAVRRRAESVIARRRHTRRRRTSRRTRRRRTRRRCTSRRTRRRGRTRRRCTAARGGVARRRRTAASHEARASTFRRRCMDVRERESALSSGEFAVAHWPLEGSFYRNGNACKKRARAAFGVKRQPEDGARFVVTALGRCWYTLRALWGCFGALWVRFGRALGHFGRALGALWSESRHKKGGKSKQEEETGGFNRD